MNILVINISLRPQSKVKVFPIGLAYIMTAMSNAGIDFEYLDIDAFRYSDEYIIKYLNDHKFDVVCLGCIVTGYKCVKWLCSEIKRASPEAVIVVGNTVASSIPRLLLEKTNADVAVVGEGDVTIVELIKRLRVSNDLKGVKGIWYKNSDGTIVANNPRKVIADIDTLPLIKKNIFDMETYIQGTVNNVQEPYPMPKDKLRAFGVNTARGCAFKCTFCYQVFHEQKYRWRSPESIVTEIKALKNRYGVNFILFNDELTFFSKKQARETVEYFIKSKIDVFWVGDCRSGLFQSEEDVELAKLFKEAGCRGLAYSLESADLEILKMMNKNNTPYDFTRQREILDKAGLNTWTSLVFGYPIENEGTIKKTFDCCIKNGIYPSAGYLLPFPGSEMYKYAIMNGHIKHEEEYLLNLGDRQDLRLNMTRMTDQQYEDAIKSGLERCNKELGLGLKTAELIKTGHYRGINKEV